MTLTKERVVNRCGQHFSSFWLGEERNSFFYRSRLWGVAGKRSRFWNNEKKSVRFLLRIWGKRVLRPERKELILFHVPVPSIPYPHPSLCPLILREKRGRKKERGAQLTFSVSFQQERKKKKLNEREYRPAPKRYLLPRSSFCSWIFFSAFIHTSMILAF